MKVLHLLRHVYTDLRGMDLIQVLDVTKTIANLCKGSGELEILYLECPLDLNVNRGDRPIPVIVEATISASKLEIDKYWNSISEINSFARYVSEEKGINRDKILQYFDTELILQNL